MNTDPHAIRTEVDAVLVDLPAGRRLEHAHQILVDALESVEKG